MGSVCPIPYFSVTPLQMATCYSCFTARDLWSMYIYWWTWVLRFVFCFSSQSASGLLLESNKSFCLEDVPVVTKRLLISSLVFPFVSGTTQYTNIVPENRWMVIWNKWLLFALCYKFIKILLVIKCILYQPHKCLQIENKLQMLLSGLPNPAHTLSQEMHRTN